MPAAPLPPSDSGLVRTLGVRAVTANAVNLLVGAAIFVLPAAVAAELGASAILAYAVCAAAMGLILLCLAEAGSRVSSTGGPYAYVEVAFGPFAGFLVGVLFWFGIDMLSSAAVAVVLAGSLGELVPAASGAAPRAILLVVLYGALAFVNIRGVGAGARLVEVVTVAKLAPLLILIVAGLVATQPANLVWSHRPALDSVGRAALVLIFAFMGAEGALAPSGEVKDPARTVPRALLLALGLVTVLYGGVQLAAQGVLGPELAQNPTAPLAAVADRALGSGGRVLVLIGALVSTFGYLCGDVLTSPRLLFAFASDGFLPARLGAVHPRFRTPHLAIATHAALAGIFALTGSFRALAVLSVVSTLLVYLACCLAALELRRRDVRSAGTPFRLPGGPAIPVAACVVVLWLLSHATRTEFLGVGAMLGVASAIYLGARWRKQEPGARRRD